MSVLLLACLPTLPADVNPYPPQVIVGETLREWSFAKDPDGWIALHDCTLSAAGGVLAIRSGGEDPYLLTGVSLPPRAEAGETGVVVRLRARAHTVGPGQFFWATENEPSMIEERSHRFELSHDDAWHDYTVFLPVTGRLTVLRFDPGTAPGVVEVATLELLAGQVHPLSIERLATSAEEVRVLARNGGRRPRSVTLVARTSGERAVESAAERLIEPNTTIDAPMPIEGSRPFEQVNVTLSSPELPPIERTVIVFRAAAAALATEWIDLCDGTLLVRVASDGSGARLEREGRLVGVLAPLVLREDGMARLAVRERSHDTLVFESRSGMESRPLEVRLQLSGDELAVEIRSDRPVEGPVVRVFGDLEQGLFAGIEHLGRGESSSSTLDIETEDHLRFAPDPLKVTMPLMAVRTGSDLGALTWRDMRLQPTFATPNFLDGTQDHRMSLRGREIQATILLRPMGLRPNATRPAAGEEGPSTLTLDPGGIEEAILWAVKRAGGLPPVPPPPRSRSEQMALCLAALQGPIAGEGGWGHCAEARFSRRWYADIASTLWRITGKVPALGGPLVPGGGHLRNDAIYLATGRAMEWLRRAETEARDLIAQQRPDGSFRYVGPFLRGHFEDTSSGLCATHVARLLEIAHLTGQEDALEAGLRALRFCERFRTPRGAQTWELSLHTPDILAAAYLVWAYVRAHELTGDAHHLARARQWALSGVPYVYLWSDRPIMLYATPPVLGATQYRAPLWIGRPVQWCGGVYARALALLAPHDATLDWRRLAEGILSAAMAIQYPVGELAGCLPDVFQLEDQQRGGPAINPSAVMGLQLALEGGIDSLATATSAKHRVTAPFPVTILDGQAVIEGIAGTRYQVIVDGQRIVDVDSHGRDELPLE